LVFPLPDSRLDSLQPRYVYYLYVRLHAGPGPRQLSGATHQQAIFIHAARGAGDIKETHLATTGTLVCKPIGEDQRYRGTFELICTEGSRLVGEFNAALDVAAVEQFEKEFLADMLEP